MHIAITLAAKNPRYDISALEFLAAQEKLPPLCKDTIDKIKRIDELRFKKEKLDGLASSLFDSFFSCEASRLLMLSALDKKKDNERYNPYNPICRDWDLIAEFLNTELAGSHILNFNS